MMEENLTQIAIEYLRRTEKFILSEAPDVIQQTLKYAVISDWIEIGVLLIFILSFLCVLAWGWFYPLFDERGNLEIFTYFARFMPALIMLPMIIEATRTIQHLVKLYVAPKLFLIQYFMNLGGK